MLTDWTGIDHEAEIIFTYYHNYILYYMCLFHLRVVRRAQSVLLIFEHFRPVGIFFINCVAIIRKRHVSCCGSFMEAKRHERWQLRIFTLTSR